MTQFTAPKLSLFSSASKPHLSCTMYITSILVKKNTIGDGGSTAVETVDTVNPVDTVDTVDIVDTVHTVDIVDTVDTVDTVYTIETALHCYNISMYACIYCQGRLERYWNGLLSC